MPSRVQLSARLADQARGSLGHPPGTVKVPTLTELERIARHHFMDLSRQDLEEYRKLLGGFLGSFRRLDEFTEPRLPVKYPRDGGYQPLPSENPYNAWYWRYSIKGALPRASWPGRRWRSGEDAIVLRAAHAFERLRDRRG